MKKYFLLSTFYFLLSTSSFSQANDWLWASYGTKGYSFTGACTDMLAVDDAGNCFYVGRLQEDSIHFGSYTLRNNLYNYLDIFLVKFDNKGNVIWAKQSQQNGNLSDINGYVVSTDGMGNAYIMADLSDTLIFDSDTLKTQPLDTAYGYYNDNFIVKYDATGNVKWARQSEIPSLYSDASGNSLATDWKGNSYITGLFNDTVYFGKNVIVGTLCNVNINNPPISYTFLVKYDANGNVKWAAQSTGRSHYGSDGMCVAVNNIDGVFISGVFNDSVTFGTFKLTVAPTLDGDVFTVKYDTNGNVKWARQGTIPSSHNLVNPGGITADRFGNVYVGGYFWDTLIFANDTLIDPRPSAYTTCVFLVKYNANGDVVWAKQSTMVDSNGWGVTALSCDNKGEVFMSGAGGGNGLSRICFDKDTLSVIEPSQEDYPSFIVKFDSSGNVLCASIIPCAGNGNSLNGMASDTSGNYVYLGGTAETEGIFGQDTVNPFRYYKNNPAATPFIARWRECEPTLGVSEIKEESSEVKVYPNPSNGVFALSCHSERSEESNPMIEVYNVLGEKVYSSSFTINNLQLTINLSAQPNGIYLYRVITENGNLIGEGKVVIQR